MRLGEIGELGRRWSLGWVDELREREVRVTERERGTKWVMGLGEIGDRAWGGSAKPIGDKGVGRRAEG